MNCPNCRTAYGDSLAFCPQCGRENPHAKNTYPHRSPHRRLSVKARVFLILLAAALVAYLAESNFFVTTFGERHDVVGVVVSQVQEGNGIKGNTYLTVANIDGQEQTLVVIQALGSTDYALYGTCVESGTVTLQSGLGNLEYPFYIQVA